MSVQLKSCFCGHCQKQVMAVRNGHTVRNVLSVPLSLGLTAKVEKWLCPDCAMPIDGSDPNAKTKLLGKSPAEIRADRWERDVARVKDATAARAAGVRAVKSRGDVWACAKNGHTLSRSRTTCPIDGSAVGWRAPETPAG